VRITDAALPPLLAWLPGRAVVVLPRELLRGLSRRQQAAIVAHELAHFRRGDHWTRWLELLALGLYWWHPAAWLACRQLRQAEEWCCDAWVLTVFPDQAKSYAQALLATVDFLSEVRTPAPAGASGFGQVHSLQRRLEMILNRNPRPQLSTMARLAILALALGVLPWTPRAFSQKADEPSDKAQSAETKGDKGPLPAAADKASVEERLNRLEKMLTQLLEAKQGEGKAELFADKLDKSQLDKSNKLGLQLHDKAAVALKMQVAALDQQIEATERQAEALQAQLAKLRDHRQSLLNKFSEAAPDQHDPKLLDKSQFEVKEALPVLSKLPHLGVLFRKDGAGASYAVSLEGQHVVATDEKTGKVLWKVDLSDLGKIHSIQVAHEHLLITGDGKRQIAIDPRTGKIDAQGDPANKPAK
jgi:hypothetical protein